MSLTHHINHVRYRKGLEGQLAGITEVRVANISGLRDFPIEEVIGRLQQGESFDIWTLDHESNTFSQEEVKLVNSSQGQAPKLHFEEKRLTHLPRF